MSFCFHCKKNVEPIDLEFSKQNSRNKFYIYIGKCPECSGKVVKLLKEKI